MNDIKLTLAVFEKEYVWNFSIQNIRFSISVAKERWEMREDSEHYPLTYTFRNELFTFESDYRVKLLLRRFERTSSSVLESRGTILLAHSRTFSQAMSYARQYVRNQFIEL